jgi:hypothetical protein
METKDTAVALLKEWKQLDEEDKAWATLLPDGANKHDDALASISRRLDEKAGAWGITIESGRFTYDYNKVSEVSVRGRSTCFLNLPAREQQAIQEWLLIKNEEKTA